MRTSASFDLTHRLESRAGILHTEFESNPLNEVYAVTQWSERRKRWFLVAFAAASWMLFTNGLASLGAPLERGGLGNDAHHLLSVVGSCALWSAVFAAFRLRLADFSLALGLAMALNIALLEVGFREQAAAAAWTVECNDGRGAACANLADHYDSGQSLVGGTLDASRLHQRACALGGPGVTQRHCEVAVALGLARDSRGPGVSPDTALLCEAGVALACADHATELEAEGLFSDARQFHRRACLAASSGDDPTLCTALLDSGYVDDRITACAQLDDVCALSSRHSCLIATQRCERARSPHAGAGR